MTISRPALAATHRDLLGKHVARLRRSGQLPAVVFGRGQTSRPVSLDTHEFTLLQRRIGPNALVDLSIDGKKPTPVLVHGVARDPIHQRLLHVDLFEVRMTEELTVEVPLVAVGNSNAVDKLGGTLLHAVEHLKVRALPDHLPQSIEVPIDGLVDFDAVVRVSDLTIPPDVTLLAELDEVVARVQAPRIEEVPAEAAEPAEGEAAEGEAAEAAASEAESSSDS